MCGIVGAIGCKNARDTVIDGLKILEYRGYDSAGIAMPSNSGEISVYKCAGRVRELERTAPRAFVPYAIGHTRWATHGVPDAVNAHPHLSFDERVAVVHNGIIENCTVLKRELISRGITFVSDTDTEIIAHLIALHLAKHYENGRTPSPAAMTEAVFSTSRMLDGAATFLAIAEGIDAVFCYRKDAALCIGITDGQTIAASDTLALTPYTDEAVMLKDGECAVLYKDKAELYDAQGRFYRAPVKISGRAPEKCSCYMRREISEIPCALMRTFENSFSFRLPEGKYTKIAIAACGTAYHAGLYGKEVIESIADIPTEVHLASEFSRARFIDRSTLAIFISQSGETADTVRALSRAKAAGATTLAVTNVRGSTLDLQADASYHLDAGAEIAVAATKSYNCQLLALYVIAHKLAGKSADISAVREVCRKAEDMICADLYDEKTLSSSLFFLGRGRDGNTAKEAALKFKEITYKSAEAYALGELKHGAIARIDEHSFAVVTATDPDEKCHAELGIQELRARGAYVVAVSAVGDIGADKTVSLPHLKDSLLYDVISIIPLQTLALNAALSLGLDPDKPRNLAKSVTVI